ncbi:MAG: sigma-E factor negative regulatory protein RseB [Gammaproteobacteria bacterium]|jgi:sigma-E factor negative regulatory protein RseB
MNYYSSSFKHIAFLYAHLRITIHLVFTSVLMSASIAISADNLPGQSAHTLINKMSSAVRNLNYDGVFIYQRGGQMNTLRLIHRADNKGEIERLVSLTGSAREVIRDKESVTCYFPDDQAVVVEKSRPRELLSSQLPQSIEKLISNYHFSIIGEDRVAGKATWVVSIKPKDAYRYGYQFWIDQDNSFLLKSELRNRTGLLLEQIMFTQLDILESVPDEMLKPSISGSGYVWHNNSDKSKEASGTNGDWQVAWMPEGFTKNNQEMYPTADSSNPVHHLVYSDGLAMVSIFIEKLEPGPELTSGLSRMGGVNTFARVTNGYQVTAVGEVPQATVQRMANSVSSSR